MWTMNGDRQISKLKQRFERFAEDRSKLRACSGYQISNIAQRRFSVKDLAGALPVLERTCLDEDMMMLEANLGDQFTRLLSAIDGARIEIKTSLDELHKKVDAVQASLDAGSNSRWKDLKERFDRVRTPDTSSKERDIYLNKWRTLEEAAKRAREDVKHLTRMLIVERDAELMTIGDVIVLKMIKFCFENPTFENFWHMKHGLDHCVASVMFKSSSILARSQSVGGISPEVMGDESDDSLFKRFFRKGQKCLEAIVDWQEYKWSTQLKKQFLTTCNSVWRLQNFLVASMPSHQVELLQPGTGSKFDEVSMEPLDCLPEDHFWPLVQFSVFPGLKVDGFVLVKSQVYLYPKVPFHRRHGEGDSVEL